MKITSAHVLFQSFSSIGPFLDFVALFPLMALYAGSALPEVTIISFSISFLTLIPVLIFIGTSHSNEGYASYVSMTLGKRIGGLTGIIYIVYSTLVLPNIIMFLSSFIFPFSSISGSFKIYFYFAFSSLYLIAIFILLSKGLRWTITPILILGLIEITSILVISLFMIYSGRGTLHTPPVSRYLSGNFWDGVIVGILMFSGGGSGIFLQRDADLSRINVRKPLVISYILTGLSLILASFAITLFLGNGIYSYGLSPENLFLKLESTSGHLLIIFFIALLFISGFNLTLSYGNALLQMSEEFLGRIVKVPPKRSALSLILVLVSVAVLIISNFTKGFYVSFLIIAVFISMLYVTVHIITGISLLRADFPLKLRVIGLFSVGILLYSIIESTESSSGYESILILLYAITMIVSSVLIFRVKFKESPLEKRELNL